MSDQRLHGKSNFTNWSLLIKTAATRYGLQDYLEHDIPGTLGNPKFSIDLGKDDVFNRNAMRIIIEVACNNPNNPLRMVYDALQNPNVNK